MLKKVISFINSLLYHVIFCDKQIVIRNLTGSKCRRNAKKAFFYLHGFPDGRTFMLSQVFILDKKADCKEVSFGPKNTGLLEIGKSFAHFIQEYAKQYPQRKIVIVGVSKCATMLYRLLGDNLLPPTVDIYTVFPAAKGTPLASRKQMWKLICKLNWPRWLKKLFAKVYNNRYKDEQFNWDIMPNSPYIKGINWANISRVPNKIVNITSRVKRGFSKEFLKYLLSFRPQSISCYLLEIILNLGSDGLVPNSSQKVELPNVKEISLQDTPHAAYWQVTKKYVR